VGRAWAALGCRYEQALALLGGDEPICDALALLDELGAAPAAAIARRRRALGVRRWRGHNSRTRSDPLGLTARTRVLNLLALQLSNCAIADRCTARSARREPVAALLGKPASPTCRRCGLDTHA
jgi:hypothetical protein